MSEASARLSINVYVECPSRQALSSCSEIPNSSDHASAVPNAEYIRALQDACDIIQADANTEENYGSLCRIGSVLAKLKAGPTKADVWIKCSDRLPDVLDVWIKMTDGSVVACWSKLDGDFYWNGGGSESYILENTVTHWKPRQQEKDHD